MDVRVITVLVSVALVSLSINPSSNSIPPVQIKKVIIAKRTPAVARKIGDSVCAPQSNEATPKNRNNQNIHSIKVNPPYAKKPKN